MASKRLSPAMLRMLRTISGHKYAWTYISRKELPTADALKRRGLVEWGVNHNRDHYNCPQVAVNAKGLQEIRRRWPNSPAARGTYEPPTDRRGNG